ncbi:MAG TPA: flagellar biosynthesis protein FlhF [Planctomycetota bacterium]|nr:flagellar biosynthesis protein FlhF [Planctomycetota bacterium]
MNFHLTRVEAPTMEEALRKIRTALGTDAMIVSTRKFRRGGVLGMGGQDVFEIYAADTRSRIENVRRQNSSRTRAVESPPRPVEDEPSRLDLPALAPGAETSPMEALSSGSRRESREERSTAPRRGTRSERFRTSEPPAESHPFLKECHETLISREVEPQVADLIVSEISRLRLPSGYPDPSRARAVVKAQLTKLFLPSPPIDSEKRPRSIMLVGPTGVGKTTTIAKLAARAKINERRRVGLITLDTFRIAAVDQLEKYAQIIGLPLVVATTPRQLEVAVEDFRARDTDLIFIDSAGRSHRDELKMAELREFTSALPEAEVHLVVSTTTHGRTILSIANRFAGIGFQKVILTKVDETISFGSFVNALISIGRPVSFVTDGQNVPDDIVPGDPERLADLVLKTNAL